MSYEISKSKVFKFIDKIANNDYVYDDFADGDINEEMLLALCLHELVWVADNGRVLVSPFGEKTLFEWKLSVDSSKIKSKLK
jgi:hypothetical protein